MYVHVTDGQWAFDFGGRTPADELLTVTRAAESEADHQQISDGTDLPALGRDYYYRDRPFFAFDPWNRALRYIAQFPTPEEHHASLL
ncbi:hypothetical protein GXW82_30690 [Streptacidiphilus sp. 4-A2]|nr:hypothetical protein [Streptacidiphilus sp. 4-A2]